MERRTPISILDDEDESVRIAVRALGEMKNGSLRSEASRKPQSLSLLQNSAPPSSQSPTSPQTRESPSETSQISPAFVARMSSIPLLKSALTVYEQGKASSRVVKYGAEMVESSVKTLSKPVINRLPVNVNQLDEFACRQLDRLDRYRRPSAGESSSQRPVIDPSSCPEDERTARRTLDDSVIDDSDSQSSYSRSTTSDIRSRRGWKDGGERGIPSWIESTHTFASGSSRQGERSATPTQSRALIAADEPTAEGGNDQQVAQRSRWQAVLLEAGGLSAALSEESMRRLKYCLQWLQYATAHIDAQILIIREFTASLQEYPPDAPAHARRPNPISEEHMRKLMEVRRDIVQTVRQVVDVVSKYAGGALPEPARATVRGFILKLPQRWATKAAATQTSAATSATSERDSVTAAASGAAGRQRNGQRRVNRERGTGGMSGLDVASPARSAASSAATSPAASPRMGRSTLGLYPHPAAAANAGASQQHVSHGAALVASQRILSLATESLDMMRGVTGVVKDSLDRADTWVTRLRTVGLQRGQQEGSEGGDDTNGTNARDLRDTDLPPRQQQHRRNSSSFSDDMPPSPFFSASTSTTASTSAWNSSIPSTPVGTFTPVSSGLYQAANAPSPNMIPLGSMTLHSRYNTPRSVKAELPSVDDDSDMHMQQDGLSGNDARRDAEEGEEDVLAKHRGEAFGGDGEVRIAGVDAELDDGVGVVSAKMEVDEV